MLIVNLAEKVRVREMLGDLKSQANGVIAKALNRAVALAKKQLPDKAGEVYNFRSGVSEAPDSKKIVTQTRANEGQLSARLTYKTRETGLHHYYYQFSPVTRGNGRDVKVAVHKGSLKSLKGAFITNINGPKIVMRAPNAKGQLSKKSKKWGVYPINVKFSVPVGAMFRHEKVIDEFNSIAEREYEVALQKYVRMAIRKANRSAAGANS